SGGAIAMPPGRSCRHTAQALVDCDCEGGREAGTPKPTPVLQIQNPKHTPAPQSRNPKHSHVPQSQNPLLPPASLCVSELEPLIPRWPFCVLKSQPPQVPQSQKPSPAPVCSTAGNPSSPPLCVPQSQKPSLNTPHTPLHSPACGEEVLSPRACSVLDHSVEI
uniref:Uncharacterized protein n=1 Tax=Gopherus agassizii TaxID=38772 RepID=A0A452HS53_9SAUR